VATLAAVRDARRQLGLTIQELWIGYFSVGGNRDSIQLAAYLDSDGLDADPVDHDYIIAALNDAYTERGLDHPLGYGTA
jgi:hypothetical protein